VQLLSSSAEGVVLELIFASLIICYFKIWGKGRGIGDEENESGRVWLNMVVYGKVFVILQGGILTIKDFMKITIFLTLRLS